MAYVEQRARDLIKGRAGMGLLDDPATFLGGTRLDAAVAFGATALIVAKGSTGGGGWIIKEAEAERVLGVEDGRTVAYQFLRVKVDDHDVFVLAGGMVAATKCLGDGT
jgi:gamma-glutamyltranspeptidase